MPGNLCYYCDQHHCKHYGDSALCQDGLGSFVCAKSQQKCNCSDITRILELDSGQQYYAYETRHDAGCCIYEGGTITHFHNAPGGDTYTVREDGLNVGVCGILNCICKC